MSYYILRYHLDMGAFIGVLVVAMLVISRWVRGRSGHGFGRRAWVALGVTMGGAMGLSIVSMRVEEGRLQRAVAGVAPTYAGELVRMGLGQLSEKTAADDPAYLRMIEAEIRWQHQNPTIADVYTFCQRADGRIGLLVDAETDYDRDGVYAGEREQRTAIGEVYEEDTALIGRAFAGEAVFTPTPTQDRWGTWISTYVPARDETGRVIGVVGVDYPAADWMAALLTARGSMLGLGGMVAVVLMASQTVVTTLGAEMARREAAEKGREELNRQLVEASRKAGKAEIAAGVLHNVGNVLNSVNVSAGLLAEKLKETDVGELGQAARMIKEHRGELAQFLEKDEVGRQLPEYFEVMSGALVENYAAMESEVARLARGVEHIKGIVMSQQQFAKHEAVLEVRTPAELFDEAVAMGMAVGAEDVTLVREDGGLPAVRLDRHQVLQILINLIGNAVQAVGQGAAGSVKRVTLRARAAGGMLVMEVEDTGAGILPEHLARMFQMGFTTRAEGHGFGLHSAANAARAMGGQLTAESAGVGQGARFRLEIPMVIAEAVV